MIQRPDWHKFSPPLILVSREICQVSNPNAPATDAALKAAQDKLDAHVRETIEWHFNPATCPD